MLWFRGSQRVEHDLATEQQRQLRLVLGGLLSADLCPQSQGRGGRPRTQLTAGGPGATVQR